MCIMINLLRIGKGSALTSTGFSEHLDSLTTSRPVEGKTNKLNEQESSHYNKSHAARRNLLMVGSKKLLASN